jgi:hypothetical protein
VNVQELVGALQNLYLLPFAFGRFFCLKKNKKKHLRVCDFSTPGSYWGMSDARQGIVHVIGPEQGFTLPGVTLVCGDSR